MSKTLAYKDHIHQDWYNFKPYSPDDVNEIKESSRPRMPRTAIPSPFAQFELVQQAFYNVSNCKDEQGRPSPLQPGFGAENQDVRLVSNALDIAQLFYEYDGSKKDLEIITWNKEEKIQELLESRNKGTVLLGETLDMFIKQENYNFDKLVSLYIMLYKGEPIGATSPTSLFIPTPTLSKHYDVTIDGQHKIFGVKRQLFDRDNKDFILYLFELFECHTTLQDDLRAFWGYLTKVKEYYDRFDPEMYDRIIAVQDAVYRMKQNEENSINDIMSRYEDFTEGVCIFNSDYKLFHRKSKDVQKNIESTSHFKINPTKTTTKSPLILSNDLNENNWNYYGDIPWEKRRHEIKYDSLNGKNGKEYRQKLPGTDIIHDWLYTNDFLLGVLVRYPFPMNTTCLFSGNDSGNPGYLLPLTPVFFEYFGVNYLFDKQGAKKNFEIIEKTDKSVDVILRVRVQGGKSIELKRTYHCADGQEEVMNTVYYQNPDSGKIIELPISLSIFPFVRLAVNNMYNIQLVDSLRSIGLDQYKAQIKLCSDHTEVKTTTESERLKEGYRTTYYKAKEVFDYIHVEFLNSSGLDSGSGVIVPRWPEARQGSTSFKFAFDFGTTNTHVEVMSMDSKDPVDLKLSKMVATLFDYDEVSKVNSSNTTINKQFQIFLKQEFLPIEIGKDYKFPQRTVVSQNRLSTSTSPDAFMDINIPFLYEKESEGPQNDITPDLKWVLNDDEKKLGSTKRSKADAFIQELMLLARAYVIQNGGDLTKTKVVWSYPLSMNSKERKNFQKTWESHFSTYFHEDEGGSVTEIPESVAPYIYYYAQGKISEVLSVSVDIGGGTSDVVVIDEKEKIKIASFRYAANVLFGDGLATATNLAKENPMVKQYYDYFKKLEHIKDTEISELLDKVYVGSSAEANAFFFSLENNPLLKTKIANLSPMKQKEYSYNYQLSQDPKRGIIFIYFYAAIIFYISRLLQAEGFRTPPRNIMFSGTGSKVLNIVADKEEYLSDLTQGLIEKFSSYRYNRDALKVVLEKKEPKQLTAKGALMQYTDENLEKLAKNIKTNQKKLTCHYSLIDEVNGSGKVLTYADVEKGTIISSLIGEVENFNNLFIEYCRETAIWENYNVDDKVFKEIFVKVVNADLEAHLKRAIKQYLRYEENELNEAIEDVLFFYPIIEIVRRNLIDNIK